MECELLEKLNPHVENKAKAINIKQRKGDNSKTNKEADVKGINFSFEISSALDDVALYK